MGVRELSTPRTVLDASAVPRGRDLEPDELEALVVDLAARPDLWSQHLAFDSEDRVYVSLHRDDHVDVWLLCWTPENDTGWHDHDVSSGAVAVISGELVENTLTLGEGARETRVGAGASFGFGPDHIHRLNGAVHGSSRCMPTVRRCGGWGNIASTRPGHCGGSRCPTPTSSDRWTDPADRACRSVNAVSMDEAGERAVEGVVGGPAVGVDGVGAGAVDEAGLAVRGAPSISPVGSGVLV